MLLTVTKDFKNVPQTTFMKLILRLNAIMIPELILHIYSFCSSTDIVAAMGVCQAWFETALTVIYGDVDFRLFVGVLGLPFAYDTSAPGRSRLVIPTDILIPKSRWEDYIPLFKHVKRISDDSVFGRRGMTSEGIDVIARSWYFGVMFPNLDHVSLWSSSIIPGIISPSIKAVRIVPATSGDTNVSFISGLGVVTANSNSLTELMISPGEEDDGPYVPHEDVRLSLLHIFQICITLVRVSLPLYYLIPGHLQFLSHLPKLEIIDIVSKTIVSPTLEAGWTGPITPIKAFLADDNTSRPVLGPDSFPCLHTLGISVADPMAAVSLLQQAHFPIGRILSYAIRITGPPYTTTSVGIRLIIETLAKRHSPVVNLCIITAAVQGQPPTNISTSDMLTYHDIRMLRDLPQLRRVQIEHSLPINITDHGLCLLTKNWNIESLILNPSPIVAMSATLTHEALLVIARNCAGLRELGLFIDTTQGDIPDHLHCPTLPSLERLHLGSSHVILGHNTRSRNIASFLSTIAQFPFILVPREQEMRLDAMTSCVVYSEETKTFQLDTDDRHYKIDEEWKFIRSNLESIRERDEARLERDEVRLERDEAMLEIECLKSHIKVLNIAYDRVSEELDGLQESIEGGSYPLSILPVD